SRAVASAVGAGAALELGGASFLFLIAALAWVFPSRKRPVLAFSQSDVQFLFTAPFTRGELIRYKVLRSQIGVFVGSAFMTLFFRPGGLAGSWMFFLGMAIAMAILNLHLTGVSLSRESLNSHGIAGVTRQWLPLTILAGAVFVLVRAVALDWGTLSSL